MQRACCQFCCIQAGEIRTIPFQARDVDISRQAVIVNGSLELIGINGVGQVFLSYLSV